jgi:hypothetical protein
LPYGSGQPQAKPRHVGKLSFFTLLAAKQLQVLLGDSLNTKGRLRLKMIWAISGIRPFAKAF